VFFPVPIPNWLLPLGLTAIVVHNAQPKYDVAGLRDVMVAWHFDIFVAFSFL